jgi:hypothetical protein
VDAFALVMLALVAPRLPLGRRGSGRVEDVAERRGEDDRA